MRTNARTLRNVLLFSRQTHLSESVHFFYDMSYGTFLHTFSIIQLIPPLNLPIPTTFLPFCTVHHTRHRNIQHPQPVRLILHAFRYLYHHNTKHRSLVSLLPFFSSFEHAITCAAYIPFKAAIHPMTDAHNLNDYHCIFFSVPHTLHHHTFKHHATF